MTNIDHKRLAREIDRRRMRRRMLTWLLLLAAAIAAAVYLRCGKGWGTGGKGPGEGGTTASAPTPDAATHCAVRLAAAGITVDGKPATPDETIEACKGKVADVLLSGDARQGDWEVLRDRLERERIQFSTREPRGVAPRDASAPAD